MWKFTEVIHVCVSHTFSIACRGKYEISLNAKSLGVCTEMTFLVGSAERLNEARGSREEVDILGFIKSIAGIGLNKPNETNQREITPGYTVCRVEVMCLHADRGRDEQTLILCKFWCILCFFGCLFGFRVEATLKLHRKKIQACVVDADVLLLESFQIYLTFFCSTQ